MIIIIYVIGIIVLSELSDDGDLSLCPQITQRASNFIILCYFPTERETVHGETFARTLRDQSHGGAHTEGCHTILCLRTGKTESSLFKYTLFKGSLF